MDDNLLPCPFCGGCAVFAVGDRPYAFHVKCTACGARTGGAAFKNDEFNREQWNNYAVPKIVEPCKSRILKALTQLTLAEAIAPNEEVRILIKLAREQLTEAHKAAG